MPTMLRLPALRPRRFRPYIFNCPFRAVSSSAPPLIRIQGATFFQNYPTAEDEAKGQNPPLFPNLDFSLPSEASKDGLQHWAVIGASGRTQFLDVLRGQYICVPPTARSYPYLLTDDIAKKDPRLRFSGNAIQYVGFSGEGSGAIGGTRGAYLSARYESLREETDWTVRQYLRGQISLNPLEEEKEGNIRDEALLSEIITELRLAELLDMPVANLSNGQTRRTRIAKALLSKPELLLLDDPFMGLDPTTVQSISDLLHRLATKSDPRLVLSLRPQDTIPDWITHLIVLGDSNVVLTHGTRSHVMRVFGIWAAVATGHPKVQADEEYNKLLKQAKRYFKEGILDPQLIWSLQPQYRGSAKIGLAVPRGGEPVIEMDGVRVQYGNKVVLGGWDQNIRDPQSRIWERKQGLHWIVRRGQRWAVLGANGSGKTTLLSLITSDHPQAYALPMKLFGRSRLPEAGKPGISIFELQSRIGHSSPEVHAFFPRQLTIRQALESAFADTFLSKPSLDYDRDLDISAALRFFKAELDPDFHTTAKQAPPKIRRDNTPFPKTAQSNNYIFTPPDHGVEYADNITFGQLSTAQQRLVLFLRALVHKPDIVILDEPFSGMSRSTRDKCIRFLEIGEQSSAASPTTNLRMREDSPWLKGYQYTAKSGPFRQPAATTIRHHGLSDQQALLFVSHLPEEIPDSVRHYVRLPSGVKGESSEIDFRCGTLKASSVLSDPKVWEMVWLSGKRFRRRARRSYRRATGEQPEMCDEDIYEWWAI
ncbi:putative ABC transporter [Aspergillus lucknowensis]|uniref:P-loop containing nucleoside triphosphate hydrolase protein n=1 Tax=Aspergillus lucknowensis TaxID=176173 RepID=A0ABR4LXB8_9EURO